MISSFIINSLKKFLKSTPEQYVFYVSLACYSLLWLINPDNKIIALAFTLLPVLYYVRLRDSRMSLLFAYLTSFIIFTGKSYDVQLIPPGIFPLNLYPLGYIIPLIISPKHILAVMMVFVLVRDLVQSRFCLFKPTKADVALFLFYAWVIISDLFASKRLEVSLPFSLLALEGVIVYCYILSYAKKAYTLLPCVLWLFASIVLFESVISFQQYMNASPIYKNIESQVNIEYFGKAVDEIEFAFRPVGTFDHANSLGLSLSFFLSLLLIWLFKYQKSLLLYIYLGGIIALAMTLSRSAWLGYGASFLFSLYVLEKVKHVKIPKIFTQRLTMISIIGILLVYYFVFPRGDKSLYSFGFGGGGGELRSLQLQDTLSLIAQHPILGVGTLISVQETRTLNPLGVFSSVPLSIHNWYLLLMAEHGIPSLIFFALFMVLSIKPILGTVRKANLSDPVLCLSVGILAGILSLFIVGLFQPFIGLSLILISFAIVRGKINNA